MRLRLIVAVMATLLLAAIAVAPQALGKTKSCRTGTVKAKVGGRAACLPKRLALPSPSKTAPGLAQLRGAVTLVQAGLTTRSGRRAAPLSRRVGRSWAAARGRLLRATSAAFARIGKPLRRPALARAAAGNACQLIDIVSQNGTFGAEGEPGGLGGSYTSNGVSVSLGVTSGGGMQLGMRTTVNGDTFTVKFESGESDCTKDVLPACPTADGTLDASGTKGRVGFSMTVTRDRRVLTRRSYSKSVAYETKGKVADDAKLDVVDVRYSENTVVENDGLRYTNYGNRLTRINMRTGAYAPGESVSFGSAALGGESMNLAGREADAGDFASFMGKTISEYRGREAAWQRPGTCAKLKFSPASNTITVKAGAADRFSAQVLAARGGVAAKARWTLGAQTNGTFSPVTSRDPEPNFAYTVSTRPNGRTLSVAVRATSTAGVAEETWSQKIEDRPDSLSGTFTGHLTAAEGVIYDWTGTATFNRTDLGPTAGASASAYQLASGDATVTVSGSLVGSGCDVTGTSTIGLFGGSPWTVLGEEAPFSYQLIVPFKGDSPQATFVNCSLPANNGTPAGLGGMAVAAIQSGDIAAGGGAQTTNDARRYTGSAGYSGPDPGQSQNWTWSFTGSP